MQEVIDALTAAQAVIKTTAFSTEDPKAVPVLMAMFNGLNNFISDANGLLPIEE